MRDGEKTKAVDHGGMPDILSHIDGMLKRFEKKDLTEEIQTNYFGCADKLSRLGDILARLFAVMIARK